MPVGNAYTSRPYSSFRGTVGSFEHNATSNSSIHDTNNNNNKSNNKNGNNYTSNGRIVNKTTNTYLNGKANATNALNPLATTSSSSAICCKKNINNSNTNHFIRQQPYRSSFYSTCYSHNISQNNNNNNNMTEKRATAVAGMSAVKPLTPKLVRRIETACTAHNTHNKARAPQPPTNNAAIQPNTASKQYLRMRNQQQSPQQQQPTPSARNSTHFERFHNTNLSFRQKLKSPAISSGDSHESIQPKYASTANNGSAIRNPVGTGSQKRAYINVAKVSKENLPLATAMHAGSALTATNGASIRSLKNYPAPAPPASIAKGATKKKYKEDQKASPSVTASPCLSNRRFITGANLNSHNISCSKATPIQRRKNSVVNGIASNLPTTGSDLAAALKNGSSGSTSSAGSSGSQGSPKTKKVFSTKFPQGLPFEDEFYRRNRSFSQSSSSSYSLYSTGGATNTPNGRQYNEVNDDDVDDEFQRKPVHDESLYVDFSKVWQRHEYNTSNSFSTTTTRSTTGTTTTVPTTTWIGMTANGVGSEVVGNLSTYRNDASLNSNQRVQRSTKSKVPNSINEYLYTCIGRTATATTGDGRKISFCALNRDSSDVDVEDDYNTPASPGTPTQKDVYAVSSWAPKCSYPTKVIVPANKTSTSVNTNNNSHQNNHYHYQHYYEKTANILEPTIYEYT